jgi:DNA-binding transcriptional ArsR family regulator
MVSTVRIAEIGALLGDPARVNMMLALLERRALTARELADAAGVTPQTASSHIGKLVAAELVQVEPQGRHRYHRLASPEVGRLLEQMHVAGAAIRHTPHRPGPRDVAMRELRSCYDHLAGRVAVDIAECVLVDCLRAVSDAQLSPAGAGRLESIGIDLAAIARRRRCFCRGCVDWSERRPHLAGAIGAALLDRVLELGWVHPQPKGRALAITADGERGFQQVFGVSAVRSR